VSAFIASIVLSQDLPADAPAWIRLMPTGDVGYPGKNFRLDDAEAVIAESRKELATMVVDFDHQTDLVMKTGAAAPAAGWIVDLEAREDGFVWARVEWTEAGRAALAARSYRFLSPVFDVAGDRVRRILRAGLTNNPAFGARLQIASDRGHLGDTDVTDTTPVAAALGLAEDASAETILARAAAITEEAAGVRRALGLAEDVDAAQVLAAIARRPAAEEYTQVAGRLQALEDERRREKATAAVDAAVKAGKVTPAQKEWATTYALADLLGFQVFVAAQPVVVAAGEIERLGREPARAAGVLDAAEETVRAALGLSKEAYLSARAEIEEAA